MEWGRSPCQFTIWPNSWNYCSSFYFDLAHFDWFGQSYWPQLRIGVESSLEWLAFVSFLACGPTGWWARLFALSNSFGTLLEACSFGKPRSEVLSVDQLLITLRNQFQHEISSKQLISLSFQHKVVCSYLDQLSIAFRTRSFLERKWSVEYAATSFQIFSSYLQLHN